MNVRRREQRGACGVVSSGAGNLWVISVAGEVDFTSTDLLELTVAEVLRSHEGAIAFDLSRLAFCDSSMLNVLLRSSRQRQVLLIGITPQTQRLLQVSGTASIFEQHVTVQDAVDATS
ncbi:STAS domain-containing protein [Streptomyces sp. NPDC001904]|uniref:STAS domain-containing protein n=1 Tax=Streptomyces sp. NPDC001904 TaxID=3154531 RepID=UPI003319013A